MIEVARGIVGMKETLRENNTKAGVLVDEVTVDFNVAASATDTSSLKIDVARTAPLGFISSASVGAQESLVQAGSRSNHITIKLKNLATASLNKPGLDWAQLCLAHPELPECRAVFDIRPPGQ